MFHILNDYSQENEVVILEEKDPSIWLELSVSNCSNYFILHKVSKAGEDFFVARRRGIQNPEDIKFFEIANRSDKTREIVITDNHMVVLKENQLYQVSIESLEKGIDK